jgi:probable phosphomutase (TIGR03848 family)
MPFVLLIRHAENEFLKKGRLAGRLPGVSLNQRGHEQAQSMAEKLKDAPIHALYSSPLERALETAAPIAAALDLEVITREGLTEVDYGEWQDKTLKSLARLKLWRLLQHRPSLFRFPGGESFSEAQHRITQEIDGICAVHDPKHVIACISHADPIKLAVAYYAGMPLDSFQRLIIGSASITALSINRGSSSLVTLNYGLTFSLPKG